MIFSLSTFESVPPGTRLDQYDGEIAADWQRPFTSFFPNLIRITNGKAHRTWENPDTTYPSLNANDHFLSNLTIPVASYVVEAEFFNLDVYSEYKIGPSPFPPPPDTVHPNGTITNSSEGYLRATSSALIGARSTTSLFDGYVVEYDQLEALWSLKKIVDGVATVSKTFFDIIPFGGKRTVQLVARGYWVELWVDGINRQLFRDEGAGAFTTANYAMLSFNSTPDNTLIDEHSTKGIHLKNFKVHDEFPPSPIYEGLLLYGTGNSLGQVSLNWTE